MAFNFEERVVADRETCQKLLIRLKLDGWAVGKTKVFLKYYHVEYLSKVYDQQLKRIIQVQSCVRRWLTKLRLVRRKNAPIKLGIFYLINLILLFNLVECFLFLDKTIEEVEEVEPEKSARSYEPDEAATIIQKCIG